MIEVFRSCVIDASAATVWALVRDFGRVAEWVPAAANCRLEAGCRAAEIGSIRATPAANGQVLREQLVALSDLQRSMSYIILTEPHMLANYTATLRLYPVTEGNKCFLVWQARFDTSPGGEEKAAKIVGQMVFEPGLAVLKTRFGRGQARP